MAQKSVLITGCSKGGLGDALAQEFHGAGFHVFATGRTLSKISHLKDMGMDVLILDVVDPASIASAVQSVTAATGGTLDILVNNSGAGSLMPMLDQSIVAAKNIFDINFFAPLAMVQAFSPLLIKSHGKILNISSVGGIMPVPLQSIYNSSKAALTSLTDTMRLELAPLGVKVSCVLLGVVKTNFIDNIPKARLPDDSVYAVSRTEIESFMSGEAQKKLASPKTGDAYSKHIVQSVIKDVPDAHIWAGMAVTMTWFMSYFVPRSVLDKLLSSSLGLKDFTNQRKVREQSIK